MAPKLRPNSFFTILTMAGNKQLRATGRQTEIKPIPQSALYRDLVAIGDPKYKEKTLKAINTYISEFKRGIKGCDSDTYMPFTKQEYVSEYIDKLNNNRNKVRREFATLVKKYLAYQDFSTMKAMIDRFLYVIEKNKEIDDKEFFDFGETKKNKKEFNSLSDISIDVVSVLVSVWTYILNHNTSSKENDAGNDAIERYERHDLTSYYVFPELNHTTTPDDQSENTAEESIESECNSAPKEDVPPKVENTMNVGQMINFNGNVTIGKIIQSGATVTETIILNGDDDYEW